MLDTLRDQIVVPDQTPKVLLILGDIMTKLQQGGSADSSQDVLTIAQYLLSPLLVLAQCEVRQHGPTIVNILDCLPVLSCHGDVFCLCCHAMERCFQCVSSRMLR